MLTKGIKLTCFIALLSILISSQTIGQSQTLQLNDWITDWYLLGPIPLEKELNDANHLPGFETDFLSNAGGEQSPTVKEGKTVSIGRETVKWKKFSGAESIVNLDRAVSKKSYVAAYAYKEINAEKDGTFILALGTNDGGSLWINGAKVWDHPGARSCKPDDNLIPVFLKKGDNTILLKIEERGNSWEFCARILPFNIDTFSKKRALFNVVPSPGGNPELKFLMSDDFIKYFFNAIKVELYSLERDAKLLWSADWPNENKMILEARDPEYKPYKLVITADRRDGKKWNQEIEFFSGERISYSLFENGKTDYRIVVGKDASESELWAADELKNCLKDLSGASFEIDDDNSALTGNEIIIGYNKHSQELLGDDFVVPDVLDESYIYKNIKSNIGLVGGKQRGTMYAVFSFLENELGVRWYTPAVTATPQREKFSFDYIGQHEEPTLQVRNDFYYEAFDPEWAAHNKINGAMGFRKQHGDIEGYWSVHTFYPLMPPAEFFDTHPEYYSLIEGKRIHEHAQLCLTNPDVLEIIAERLLQKMRENPSNLIYSVSQNDWRNPCQCDKCQQIVKEKDGESGIMIWFVNQVADIVKEEFPDKYIGTLAYQYTRKPPKNIVPRDNVVVRLCSIECCFAHDFKSCPENRDFTADLEGWSSISPHLYIWDYVVNFSHYIMPYPNFNVLQANIKTFIENNSIGIMEQAAYQSRGGEFSELRAYVISRLLWNSESDVDEVINDFLFGYYGRSGQYIRNYFDLLHGQITPDTHIHLGLDPDDKIFSDRFILEADKIFDDAEIVADSDVIKGRVEMARLPLMYLKCKRKPLSSIYDGTYERFNKIVEREGITHFAEAGKPHAEAFHEQVKNAR